MSNFHTLKLNPELVPQRVIRGGDKIPGIGIY
jgi:hypothetical protein